MPPYRNLGETCQTKLSNKLKNCVNTNKNHNKIKYKYVKEAFDRKIILDVNNQTYFKSKNGTYRSLLHAALDRGDHELVNFLLDQGANPNIVEPGKHPFFIRLIKKTDFIVNEKELKKLLYVGVDINGAGTEYRTSHIPLKQAFLCQRETIVEFLLNNGANLYPPCSSEDCSGCSPLQSAVKSRMYHVIDMLLAKNIDVNACCKNTNSPLQLATERKEIKLMERLLDRGADVNGSCRYFLYDIQMTALHFALDTDCLETLEFLLNYELTDLEHIVYSNNNFSILHYAAYYLSFNCIDYLLNANPDVNLISGEESGYKLAFETIPNNSINFEILEKLKKHLVKLRAAGLYLNDRNLVAASGKKYDDFYGECCQQVDLLKKTAITAGSHVYFYDLLFMNKQQLALCLESSNNQEIWQPEFSIQFSLYAGMIQFKLNKANQWNKLREEVYNAVYSLFNHHLPYHIMQKILSYFTVNELLKLRTDRKNKETLQKRSYWPTHSRNVPSLNYFP